MSGSRAQSPANGTQRSARVLLVDDDAGDQYLVRRALDERRAQPPTWS